MKPSRKLLFSAAGLTIAASGLLMGVGSASADVCVKECGETPLPVLKLENAFASNKVPVSEFVINKVLEETTPVFFP